MSKSSLFTLRVLRIPMKLPEFPLDVARVYFQLSVEIKLVPIKVRNSPANKEENISRYELFFMGGFVSECIFNLVPFSKNLTFQNKVKKLNMYSDFVQFFRGWDQIKIPSESRSFDQKTYETFYCSKWVCILAFRKWYFLRPPLTRLNSGSLLRK